MPEPRDLYKALQVDPEADVEVIQAAYRRLAHKFHPDLASGEDARRRMIEINAAWEVLGDPRRRAAYDRERARAHNVAPPGRQAPAPGEAGAPGAARSSGAAGWGGTRTGHVAAGPSPRQAEPAGRDWTSGRSSSGGGYDPATMRSADGLGAAGRPPGNPSGSVLNFGRYAGWSIGELARMDLEYLEWLERSPIGRQYQSEIDDALRRAGRRGGTDADHEERRGLFRRR